MNEDKKSGWIFVGVCIIALILIIWGLSSIKNKEQSPAQQNPTSSYNYLINVESGDIVNEVRCWDEINIKEVSFNASLVYEAGEFSDYVSKNIGDTKITYKITHPYLMLGEDILNNEDFKKILNNWTDHIIRCRTHFETFNYDIYDNGYKESKKIYLYDSLDITCEEAPEKEEGWKCSYFYDYENYEIDFSNIPYKLNERIVNYDFDR